MACPPLLTRTLLRDAHMAVPHVAGWDQPYPGAGSIYRGG